MSEVQYANPYGIEPATMMQSAAGHDNGNALMAQSEARAVAEVKAQVIMARQFPRNPMLAMEKIIIECRRPTLAERATYAFSRGGTSVTGPSIRLAEVLARGWGNLAFGYDVLDRSNGRSVVSAYAWDLESNLRASAQFEVKHMRSTKSGGYALTDDRDIYELEANMAARRKRSCILQLIPGDVVDAALDACKATLASDIVTAMANPAKREKLIRRMIELFSGFGASRPDIEEFINVPAAQWDANHIVKLRQVYTAIEDGGDAAEYFPRLAKLGQNTTITAAEVNDIMALVKKTGKQQVFQTWLKKEGISKVADIPLDKRDAIYAYIATLAPSATVDVPAEVSHE